MPVFQFEALDSSNHKVIEGTIEAESIREAKEILRSQGTIPTRLELDNQTFSMEATLEQLPLIGDILAAQVGLKDINIMTQQLYTLLNAGIPLIEALYLLEQQTENKKLKVIMRGIRQDVIAGDSFSSALNKYPKHFSRLYVNMMKSGEVSGDLDLMCSRLAGLLEKMMVLQSKVQGALVYPAFTVLVVIAVVVVILLVVVPQFETMFMNAGRDLPLPTQVLIATSEFAQAFWWAIALVAATLFFWFEVFRRGKGKPLVDQWILTIPLVGDVMRKVYVSRFVRTLGTVVGSGVSLTEALVTSAGTVDNYVLKAAFDRAKESLIQGGTLSKPLEKTGAFPIMVVKMIAIAEETGQMEEMLNKSADFLDMEVDRAVETMTTMIEPIMIIVLGGIILGVALALYIPMFEMHQLVG